MVAYGIPLEEIAAALEITRKTLSKHFTKEIRSAKPMANAKVAESLFNEALKGKGHSKVTAAIFWLKCQAGWKESMQHELTSPSDRPVKTLNEFYGKRRKS